MSNWKDTAAHKPIASAAVEMKHVFVTWSALQAAAPLWDAEEEKCQWKLGQSACEQLYCRNLFETEEINTLNYHFEES